jgi:hypothetical protein
MMQAPEGIARQKKGGIWISRMSNDNDQHAEEAAKEKFYALLDELTKLFPKNLPVFVACHRASKKPSGTVERLEPRQLD